VFHRGPQTFNIVNILDIYIVCETISLNSTDITQCIRYHVMMNF